MTDNKIIKALKELLELMLVEGDLQKSSTISRTIDLINRQNSNIEEFKSKNSNLTSDLSSLRTEIERLQKYHDDMENAIYSFREDQAEVKFFKGRIRAEAVKEFAEMVKETAVTNITVGGSTYYCVGLHHLDNLEKEFTGGKENEPPKVFE